MILPSEPQGEKLKKETGKCSASNQSHPLVTIPARMIALFDSICFIISATGFNIQR